jgi:hypothetical protein
VEGRDRTEEVGEGGTKTDGEVDRRKKVKSLRGSSGFETERLSESEKSCDDVDSSISQREGAVVDSTVEIAVEVSVDVDVGEEDENEEIEASVEEEARRRGFSFVDALLSVPAWTMMTFSGRTAGGEGFLCFERWRDFGGEGGEGGSGGVGGATTVLTLPGRPRAAIAVENDVLEAEKRKEGRGNAPLSSARRCRLFFSFGACFALRRVLATGVGGVSTTGTGVTTLVVFFTTFASVPLTLNRFTLTGVANLRIISRCCKKNNLASSALPARKALRVIPAFASSAVEAEETEEGGGGRS